VQIRRATDIDLASIAKVHRASIQELCAARYTAAQIGQWLAALRPEGYALLLAAREMFVADEGGAIHGFGVLDLGQAFINATYVDPIATHRGVGRSLVEAMESTAVASGATSIGLHATLNAANFYERLGYARLDDTVNRLPTGLELPCVAMRKAL
jgi:putative acetyltransferase